MPRLVEPNISGISDDIEQNAALFTYKYESVSEEWDETQTKKVKRSDTLYANFESEYEGTIAKLEVEEKQVITREFAASGHHLAL